MLTELRLKQAAMVADVYSRTHAATVPDAGLIPDVEARKAVKGFIQMMKKLDSGLWSQYNEEDL